MTWVCRLHEVTGTSLWCSEERHQGSAALPEALLLCCFSCSSFKLENSQGSVRETIQPRQKQSLGSKSALTLVPQNPVQSGSMDSMDLIVSGDGHDGECLVFSSY